MNHFSGVNNVVVVGAGIAGVCIGVELLRRGLKVTLIDCWEPGHARASSSDYNRVIRATHGKDEFYTKWAREARLRWLELQAETKQKLYYECGALILATEGLCDWENDTENTFRNLGIPYYLFDQKELSLRFPQFDTSSVKYGIYEPEAGMIMAHRAVITIAELFSKMGGVIVRERVSTDVREELHIRGKPIEADLIVVATGAWMKDMYPKTLKQLADIIGVNVIYTSTPMGSEDFDVKNMPCWVDHGEGSFGLPSVEGSGVKAAVVIPDKINLDNDERLIRKESLVRTRQYIRNRLPGLIGEKAVDSKFNQVMLTPDTHFIVDWHPEHKNVLIAGGCSGHLFKHAPVFADFVAGVGLRNYGTAERFKIKHRKKLSPKDSPSGR